jgi:precorrin isomerase
VLRRRAKKAVSTQSSLMWREVGMLQVVGELGATVIAAAIGNAIFAAVAVRLRNPPIRPAVPEALGHA